MYLFLTTSASSIFDGNYELINSFPSILHFSGTRSFSLALNLINLIGNEELGVFSILNKNIAFGSKKCHSLDFYEIKNQILN